MSTRISLDKLAVCSEPLKLCYAIISIFLFLPTPSVAVPKWKSLICNLPQRRFGPTESSILVLQANFESARRPPAPPPITCRPAGLSGLSHVFRGVHQICVLRWWAWPFALRVSIPNASPLKQKSEALEWCWHLLNCFSLRGFRCYGKRFQIRLKDGSWTEDRCLRTCPCPGGGGSRWPSLRLQRSLVRNLASKSRDEGKND